MLRLIGALGPVAAIVIGLLGGGAVTGAAAWFGRGLIFDWFEKPAIVRAERQRCADEVELAAANARRIEQQRQITIANQAMEQAAREEAALEAAHAENVGKLTEELKAYEAQRAGEGRSCPLTDADLRFLLGD